MGTSFTELATKDIQSFTLPNIELGRTGRLSHEARMMWLMQLSEILKTEDIQALADIKERLYDPSGDCGYALIRSASLLDIGEETQKRIAFALCCYFGSPLRILSRRAIWHDVPVNLNAPPDRFSGTGHNPFHIDIVNARKPPELVAFHCVRDDPLGGGKTLLANMHRAIAAMGQQEQNDLRRERFVEGKFFDIENTDGPLDPYPVVDFDSGRPLFRFTARAIEKQDTHHKRMLLSSLNDKLNQISIGIRLKPGDILIINQRVIAHAREPLGSNQEELPEGSRRLLRRLFLEFEDTTP